MVGVDALSQALTNPLLSRQVYDYDTFGAGMGVIRETHRLADIVRRNVPPGSADGWLSLARQGRASG
jgi:prostaglandin-endoperoxide synthase 2